MLTHDATNTDALPLLDERIDKYTLLREIGRGGMGVVYEAAQDGLDRHVAIKVCLQSNARFSREANTTARLDHPNIVSAFEFGESNGITWLVMPLVNGVSLDNVRALKRDQDWQAIESIGTQIASALHYAHLEGVVHRDVKPANIILDEQGKAWITDFGVASCRDDNLDLTSTDEILGTPSSMAPEQLLGSADERTDVFGLGITLYRYAISQKFDAAHTQEIITHGFLSGFPSLRKLVDAPVELDRAIMRAIRRVPAERYVSALEFKKALQQKDSIAKQVLPFVVSAVLGVALATIWARYGLLGNTSPQAGVFHHTGDYHLTHRRYEVWMDPVGLVRTEDTATVEFLSKQNVYLQSFDLMTDDPITVLSAADNLTGPYERHRDLVPQAGQFSASTAGHITDIRWHFEASDLPREFTTNYSVDGLAERYQECSLIEFFLSDENATCIPTTMLIHNFGDATSNQVQVWSIDSATAVAERLEDGSIKIEIGTENENLDPGILLVLPQMAFPGVPPNLRPLTELEPNAPYIRQDGEAVTTTVDEIDYSTHRMLLPAIE